MGNTIAGAIIGLVSSLLTSVIVTGLAHRRDLRTRWDRDTLTTVSQSLVSVERAMGRIYAWSRGELTAVPGLSRPDKVDDMLDLAYYQLQELSILFPKISAVADRLQSDLVALAELTGNASASAAPDAMISYGPASEQLRTQIRSGMAQMRVAAQQRLSIG